MFDVKMDDNPAVVSTAKLFFNGMVVAIVVVKFAEIVTGKRLTP